MHIAFLYLVITDDSYSFLFFFFLPLFPFSRCHFPRIHFSASVTCASVSWPLTVNNRLGGKTVGGNLISRVIKLLTDMLHKEKSRPGWGLVCCSCVTMAERSVDDLLTPFTGN